MAPKYFRVCNWDRYQHYKNRTPPWIKLYNSLLDDHAFCSLPDASKAHFLCILLAASRHDNCIPLDGEWLMRFMHATESVDLRLLCAVGLLAPCTRSASKVLASCKQVATPEREKESEREAEEETERKGEAEKNPPTPRASRSTVTDGFDRAWNAYPHYEQRSRRAQALTVWRSRGLESVTETVLAHVEACQGGSDWQRERGQFIPGFQVWLKGPDFSQPPEPRIDRGSILSEKGQATLAAGLRWLERTGGEA